MARRRPAPEPEELALPVPDAEPIGPADRVDPRAVLTAPAGVAQDADLLLAHDEHVNFRLPKADADRVRSLALQRRTTFFHELRRAVVALVDADLR
jgi:hypothetical protein